MKMRRRRKFSQPIEQLEIRRMLAGSISGNVYKDLGSNGIKDGADSNIAGWVVYLDNDNSNTVTGGDTMATTDGSGNYSFTNLADNTYHVRQVLQSGYRKTQPGAGTPGYNPVISGGNAIAGQDFGDTQNVYLAGKAYNDANSNGVQDGGEAGIPGVVIQIKSPAGGSTIATRTTDAQGFWQVKGLSAGSGEAVASLPAGMTATSPADHKYTGSASSGELLGNLNFGYKAAVAVGSVLFTTQSDFGGWFQDGSPQTVVTVEPTVGDSDASTTNGLGNPSPGTSAAGSVKIVAPAGSTQTYNQVISTPIQPNLPAVQAVKANHTLTLDYYLPTAINVGTEFWQINVVFNWDGGYVQSLITPNTTFTGAGLTVGQHTAVYDYSAIQPNLPSGIQGTYYNIIFAIGFGASLPSTTVYIDNVRVSGGAPAVAAPVPFSESKIQDSDSDDSLIEGMV